MGKKLFRDNYLVNVDRSVVPEYPEWLGMESVLHPELELAGPVSYRLSDVNQFVCFEQKTWWVVEDRLYDSILKEGITACLNLQDALAIQKMGPDVFRSLFDRKEVYFWGSALRVRGGGLGVPFLYLEWPWKDSVELYWHADIRAKFCKTMPALRFRR